MKFLKILVIGGNIGIGRNLMEYISFMSKQDDGIVIDIESFEYDRKQFPDIKNYHWVINAHTPSTLNNIDEVLIENFDFNKQLFKDCNKFGVNFQWISSSKVYGYTHHHPTEFTACNPIDNLSFSQYLFDRWVFIQEHNIIAQGFRHFDVYGKYIFDDIIHKFKDEVIKNNRITLDTNSYKIKKDFIWVQDVCKIHYNFIKNVHGSGLWNVGSGLNHSLFDIADDIANIHNIEIEYKNLNNPLVNIRSDNTLLKKTMGSIKFINIYEFLINNN